MSNPARFLSRWSRLKRQTLAEAPAAPAVAPEFAAAVPGAATEEAVAPIPPGTDLTALLREELSATLRKQALKAIFADPHFNVMDGLDTYIDDYSISEPIPSEMLATLNQARFLFETDEEKGELAAEAARSATLGDDRAGQGCDNLTSSSQEVSAASFSESAEKEK